MKKKTSDRIWNSFSFLFLALTAAAQGLLLWQIWKLHMLPQKFFLPLCGGCLILTCLIGFLLRKKRGRRTKQSGRGRRFFGIVLCVLLLAGCCLGSYAVGQVQSTVNSITAPQTVKVVLEIYVLAEDPAASIADTAGYTYGLPQDITEAEIAPVVQELQALLQGNLKLVQLANTTAQLDALFSGEVDAVVLNSAYLSILEETEGYEDYASRLKLLHETVVEKEVPQDTPALPENPSQEHSGSIQEGPEHTGFLCYISGIDSRHNIHTNGRSDVNILVAVNPQTHQILMVNTPRDYYVVNPISGSNAMDKLTHCGVGGVTNSMEALGILYGHSPEYYARINFSGFETLVNAIGGVTVYSDRGFTAGTTYIYQGENRLNGSQALEFARERKNLPGGDNARGRNQMKLIAAIVNQLSASTLLSNYSQILASLEGMFVTSMPAEKIGELVQTQIADMPKWEIFSFAVTGTGGSDHCWAAGGYGYVMYPHQEVVSHASSLIEKVLTSQILTEADMTVPE